MLQEYQHDMKTKSVSVVTMTVKKGDKSYTQTFCKMGGGGPTCLKISPLLIYKKVQLYGHSQDMHNSLKFTKTIIFLAF